MVITLLKLFLLPICLKLGTTKQLIDTSDCGVSKGCWLMPPGCTNSNDSKACDSIITWSSINEGVIIEIEGKVSDVEKTAGQYVPGFAGKYISMAFSYDDKMGEDAVLECVARPDGKVSAYLSFNDDVHNYRMYQASKSMLKNTTGAMVDGRIVCRTVRTFDPTDDIPAEERFKLFYLKQQPYTLMYAYGPTVPGESFEITYHYLSDGPAFPWVSRDKIRITENKNINSMKQYDVPRSVQYRLVKVHGIFMLFGWWICAAIATILSRYFKSSWPETKLSGTAAWFQFHRGLMIASLILQCIAFAFIFIQAGDFKMCPYICQSDDYALKVHTILGIVCTAVALIQPFIAWARPVGTSSMRPIFNWVHWFLGMGSWIIATVTIFLSAPLGKSGLRRNFNFAPDYLMAGYVASFILATILLEMLAAYYDKKSAKIDKKPAVPTMPLNGPKAVAISNGYTVTNIVVASDVQNGVQINSTKTEDATKKRRRKFDTVQTWILVCFTIIAFGIVIALTVLISLD